MTIIGVMWMLDVHAQQGRPQTDRELRGMGFVIQSQLAPGASPKRAVLAVSDAGNVLFLYGELLASSGKAVASIGGGANMSFPRWAHVTWRAGEDVEYEKGNFSGGKIIGDFKVEILSRIPGEVFRYANSAPRRAIRLIFHVKDDGVLLAWDVQESFPKVSGFMYSMHGGDFPCETSPYQSQPNCTDGMLRDAPWYNSAWER